MHEPKDLRDLPSITALLNHPETASLVLRFGPQAVTEAFREAVETWRQRLTEGAMPPAPLLEAVWQEAEAVLRRTARTGLRPVINATGVIVHTNLGRSVLAEAAAKAVYDIARSYNNLEADLETGTRSSRHAHIADRLRRVIGAEAGAVFNNNAAAVMLALATVAKGREVIVSRGQLVEIGGSFRVPEVIEQSGCILREVGATNRTHLRDYERALGENSAALLRAHQSNYRIIGFTTEPSLKELADLAHAHGLPLIDDLGSGALVDLAALGVGEEPTVAESLAAGADIVTFSGDKLLGGPQCGIAVGRPDLIEAMKKHPLARAVRCGKLTIAALSATLDLIADPPRALREIPTLRAATEPIEEVAARAEQLAGLLRESLPAGVQIAVVRDTSARVGGGSLPEQELETASVYLTPSDGPSPNELARRLRLGEPSVYPRVHRDALILDARTVFNSQVEDLAGAVIRALTEAGE
ncbi:L-seryl-tRNA(Sec) selenium transferase [bacterium]|nr:L-seryl-tRNA(Sec) selenium transferase [bacterium]